MFIIYMNIPPKIELKISFNIFFSGHINIFPKINKKIIHAKNVIIITISLINLYD